jgi:hypothetical protein
MITDIETLVKKHMQPGQAIMGRFALPDRKLQTGFFVREDSAHIKAVPKNPTVEFRAGMFDSEGQVIPVVVMLKIQGLQEPYETWWNYYQADGGEKYFNDMISQSHVVVHLYTSSGKKRSIQVKNSLSDSFSRFKARIEQVSPWSMDKFNAERDRIYSKYPSLEAFWDGLVF